MREWAAEPAGLIEEARKLAAAGEHAGVVHLLDKVSRETLLRDPELGYHLAYSLRRVARAQEALELVEALDIPTRRNAADWLARRRTNLEAMLRFDAGDSDAAAALWAMVAELAAAAEDRELLAAAHNNLGVILTLRDDVEGALAAYHRALLAYRGMGDRRGIAQTHQNLAILHRELGRRVEAEDHFEQALHSARLAGSEDVRGRIEEERALLQLDAGDTRLAEVAARRALQRFARISDRAGTGEALRVLGIIAMRERLLGQAQEFLLHALSAAHQIHNPLLEAETREALAVLADLQGSPPAAQQHRDEASALFAAISAEPWGRRIRERTIALASVS